ncbi:MAG: hypothetical protein M3Y56_13445, partial [Armatimonadota bacterium]|nr:hypothetical protein [Armatimonadota bacterium]
AGLCIGLSTPPNARFVKWSNGVRFYKIEPTFQVTIRNTTEQTIVFSRYQTVLRVFATAGNGRPILDRAPFLSDSRIRLPGVQDIVSLQSGEMIIIPVVIFGVPSGEMERSQNCWVQAELRCMPQDMWPVAIVRLLKAEGLRMWGGDRVVSPKQKIVVHMEK